MEREANNTFLRHLPCENCGSSDGDSLYSDMSRYCFVCQHYTPPPGDAGEAPSRGRRPTRTGARMADLIQGEIVGLRARKISQETCKKFNYQIGEYRNKPVQIAPYYNADGQLVAQKVRDADKDFRVLGDIKSALPFGSQAWPKGGKMLVLTEGEIDAMAVAQLWGGKYPAWSISCGADKPFNDFGDPLPMNGIRKYIATHREHFLKFDKVVICFDSDEPGKASAKVAAQVIGPTAVIAELPLKDAGEMLEKGRTEELIKAIYNAQPYRPDGIVDLASLKDAIKERPKTGLSWCLPTLTSLTYGKRLGELVALGAGTGVGKTDLLTQDMLHMVKGHGEKIGIFALEQQPNETGLRFVGKAAERPMHIPDYWDEELFDSVWESLVESGNVFLFDHFGAMDWDTIAGHIEYLHNVHGVGYFYLDHLTALAAAESNEREGLERIMASMGALVKKIPIHITFVSHLATPDGKPHEEGGRVMIRHFKGSRSIGFWSHFMIGLERDQQAEDEDERQTTTVRILKDRYTGRSTGQTFFLGYDAEKGLLYEKAASPETYGFDDETAAEAATTEDF